MYDVKAEVNTLLSTIPDVKVSASYPKDFADLPQITFYEAANTDPLGIKTGPLSDVAIQVDIWHNRSTGALAASVDEKMNSIGFRRELAADVPDPNVNHKTMRYRGVVDTRSLRVSQ